MTTPFHQWPIVLAIRELLRREFAIDLRSLAVLRIALAGILIADVIERSFDAGIIATRLGINFAFIQQSASTDSLLPAWSLLGVSASPAWLYLVLGLKLFAALALLIGFRTQLAVFVSWMLQLSVIAGSGFGTNGELLLSALLFFGLFLPLGRVASVDAKFEKWPPLNFPIYSGVTAATLLFVGLIYWSTAISKLPSLAWQADYTALELTLRSSELNRPFGDWLLHFPDALSLFTRGMIWLETFVPLLVFVPIATRWIRLGAVPLMIGLHAVALNLSLDLGWFEPTLAAVWILFLPTEAWDWLSQWRRGINNPFTARMGRAWNRLTAFLNLTRRPPHPFWHSPRMKRTGALLSSTLCLLIFAGMFISNLGYLLSPRTLQPVAKAFEFLAGNQFLNDSWIPLRDPAGLAQNWYSVEVSLANGTRAIVSDIPLVAAPDYQGGLNQLYPNARWRQIREAVRAQDAKVSSDLRNRFAHYVVREWCEKNRVRFADVKKITLISNTTSLEDSARANVTQKRLAVSGRYLDKIAEGGRWVPLKGHPLYGEKFIRLGVQEPKPIPAPPVPSAMPVSSPSPEQVVEVPLIVPESDAPPALSAPLEWAPQSDPEPAPPALPIPTPPPEKPFPILETGPKYIDLDALSLQLGDDPDSEKASISSDGP